MLVSLRTGSSMSLNQVSMGGVGFISEFSFTDVNIVEHATADGHVI